MTPPTHSRSAPCPRALACAVLGAVLATGLASAGCDAPVAPTFELYFRGPTGEDAPGCQAAAAGQIRMMCDSVLRVRVLDENREYNLVPPVCERLNASETGTMAALAQADIALESLPLGPAWVEVDLWNAADLDNTICPNTNPPSADRTPRRALLGSRAFEIGRDELVRIPLSCTDLAAVNRFSCGLDVEIVDLDRGRKLHEPRLRDIGREDGMQGVDPVPPESPGVDLEALEVRYGMASEQGGAWVHQPWEAMDLHLAADGTAVWRARPTETFWRDIEQAETLCIQVIEQGAPANAPPQVTCYNVEDGDMPSWRLQVSYLPGEDLECLLAAGGDGPEGGIVIGRVVAAAPDEQAEDERPVANAQVFPRETGMEVPVAPLIHAGSQADGEDPAVQYVSKETTTRESAVAATCRVEDAAATTSSGYFLSDAAFPARWTVETHDGAGAQAVRAGDGQVPIGGRIHGVVNIVRIALQ